MVSEVEERCDDIVSVETVFLPAFDNDSVRDSEFVRVFYNIEIA